MKVNTNIFKAYDIRGVYPEYLNEEMVFKIGQAFVAKTGASKIVVGQDMRLSSPALFRGLAEGITSQGADVLNIGQVPTECLYFATANYGYEAGIMITASHNPKEYNGFKMLQRKKDFYTVLSGKEIGLLINQEFKELEKGEVKELDIWQDYISHIFSFVNLREIQPLKIIVDTSNGMAGKVFPKISSRLPVEIISLNSKLDGNFPNHPPNPLLEESKKQIVQKIKEEKADLGFIFDGDGDRIFLIDEKGEFIKGDITLLLLAKFFLEKYPGKGIAYSVICSKVVPEFIKKQGGNPLRSAVGFVNLNKALIENDGVLSGELAGHYSFKDNYYLDSGFVTFLVLLEIISKSRKKVSELVKEFSLYEKTEELNFKIRDKEKTIEKIKEKYSDGEQDFLDGLTVTYNDWWFNVRPSNTEPLLRLTIEAEKKDLLEEKKKELVSFIEKLL